MEMVWVTVIVSILAISPVGNVGDIRTEDSLRRAEMTALYHAGDREGFLERCNQLIEYHRGRGNDKYLFDAYATRFDRLMLWGKTADALSTVKEMSEVARQRKSAMGSAITEFCFGHFYLDSRHPQEAEVHHLKAFRQLQELGEDGRALRSGFNLQAIQMNLNNPRKGLAVNDSNDVLLHRMEARLGRISPHHRFKQSRYRMRLLTMLDSLEAAAVMRDTMLYYAAILNDPVQDEIAQSALAEFDWKTGNKAAAYSRMEALIDYFKQEGNYLKTAQYREALASYQYHDGDMAKAVENYRLYVCENDSAHVRQTAEEMNVLTKQYELDKLRMENQLIQRRLSAATVILLLFIILGYFAISYALMLQRKNRVLYQLNQEALRKEDAAERIFEKAVVPTGTREEKLYSSLVRIMHEQELFKNPDLGREYLAARLATNRTTLSRAVKNISGKTLVEFINHYRLRHAVELLEKQPELSIQEIEESSGFASRTTFYRQFSAHYGMSPSEYRLTARNTPSSRR